MGDAKAVELVPLFCEALQIFAALNERNETGCGTIQCAALLLKFIAILGRNWAQAIEWTNPAGPNRSDRRISSTKTRIGPGQTFKASCIAMTPKGSTRGR